MTAHTPAKAPVLTSDTTFIAEPVHEETPRHLAYRFTMAATRLALGWVFLWAFLDKTFGLGHETPTDGAWITGPFADFYKDIAGATWADWMFMVGLAGIGIALVLGVAMRIAAVSGALLLVMMWTAVLPPENNPVIDDHIVYALVLGVLALASANKTLGLGRVWERIPLVARYGFLK
jgi:thiosulfate dehydrogenase [quinone] large subunit